MAVILVIDDSSLARASVKKVLTPDGYEIIEATDGETGMDMLSRYAPDCVVMDILMPKISGIDVLKQLQSSGSNIPVIIVTADIQDSVREKCLNLGAFAVVNKPLLLKDLAATVREALKGKGQ